MNGLTNSRLLTADLTIAFFKQGDTSEKSMEDIQIIMKLHYPGTGLEWYVYEDQGNGYFMAFANLNDPMCAELGAIYLPEMEATKVGGWMSIEVDKSVEPFSLNLKEVYDKIKGR